MNDSIVLILRAVVLVITTGSLTAKTEGSERIIWGCCAAIWLVALGLDLARLC